MVTISLEADQRFDSIGTLDIETTGLDGSSDELVAVGVGYHEAGRERAEIDVLTRARARDDERTLVADAYGWLNERAPGGLATYNGADFDLPFLDDRMAALGCRDAATLSCADRHVDLHVARRRAADEAGRTWPSLEEALGAYDLPVYATRWAGEELTNARFGEILAPRYLDALVRGDDATVEELDETVVEYTAGDVEATVALYEADAGRTYVPGYAD